VNIIKTKCVLLLQAQYGSAQLLLQQSTVNGFHLFSLNPEVGQEGESHKGDLSGLHDVLKML
jgi:hypothetical protein